ncbi:unnamed protein product [Choristocarpus tenellus]
MEKICTGGQGVAVEKIVPLSYSNLLFAAANKSSPSQVSGGESEGGRGREKSERERKRVWARPDPLRGKIYHYNECSSQADSEEFSEGDTVYEEPEQVVRTKGEETSSVRTSGSRGNWSTDLPGRGGSHREERHGAGGTRSMKRGSTGKFNAVMDTLAAQVGRERGWVKRLDREERNVLPSRGYKRGDWCFKLKPCPEYIRLLQGTQTYARQTLPILRGVSLTHIRPVGLDSMANQRLGIYAAVSELQGKRSSQEDRVQVLPDLSVLGTEVSRPYLFTQFSLFGVYDGHSGSFCSEALAKGLHLSLVSQSAFHHSMKQAMLQAFSVFDHDLCERQREARG